MDLLDDTLEDLEREPDPRRAMIGAWARMERGLAAAGLPRHPAEAPFEYAGRVLEAALAPTCEDTPAEFPGPLRPHSVHRLTGLFERAQVSAATPSARPTGRRPWPPCAPSAGSWPRRWGAAARGRGVSGSEGAPVTWAIVRAVTVAVLATVALAGGWSSSPRPSEPLAVAVYLLVPGGDHRAAAAGAWPAGDLPAAPAVPLRRRPGGRPAPDRPPTELDRLARLLSPVQRRRLHAHTRLRAELRPVAADRLR